MVVEGGATLDVFGKRYVGPICYCDTDRVITSRNATCLEPDRDSRRGSSSGYVVDGCEEKTCCGGSS